MSDERHDTGGTSGDAREPRDRHRAYPARELDYSFDPRQPYDPSLQLLARLEQQVAHNLQRADRRQQTRSALARVIRRVTLLLGCLSVAGATAYAAQTVLGGSHRDANLEHVRQGPIVLLVHGRASGEHWTLQLYERGGQLCRLLLVGYQEESRCAPLPRAASVGASTVQGPFGDYVFGVTGRSVAAVRVDASGTQRTVATRPIAAREGRAATFSGGTRYFLAILPRPVGETHAPPLVRGLDHEGRAIGVRQPAPS